MVSSIAHLTARDAPSPDEFAEAFTGRLAALGRSHELLTAARWERASLPALVASLTEPHAEQDRRIEVRGEPVDLAPRDLIALGMILYELLTNATKYGALSRPEGSLSIAWQRDGEAVELIWTERGAGSAMPPARTGFGTRMIDSSARHDLAGVAEWDWSGGGLIFRLRFRPR